MKLTIEDNSTSNSSLAEQVAALLARVASLEARVPIWTIDNTKTISTVPFKTEVTC